MAERANKRRRLNQPNPFIDLEAEAHSEGEEEDDDDNEDEECDEDEQYADSVLSHSQLHCAIQNDGNDDWSGFLDRARKGAAALRRNRSDGFLEETILNCGNLQCGGTGDDYTLKVSDTLWEIGCRVGYEEVVAFKVVQRATNPSCPQILARSVVGRASIPGRIYAEVASLEEARHLALTVAELIPSVLRKVPDEERLQVLGSGSSRFRSQTWARVRGRKKKWAPYRGDTGLVQTVHSRKSLVLIPRISNSVNETRASQQLAPRDELISRHGHHQVDGPLGSGFLCRGRRYTEEGFLVVDLDDIDVIPCIDALPTCFELELFRSCPLLRHETWRETSVAILHSRLKPGDRVRIVAGDYLGLNGTIVEVFDDEVEVNITTQDVKERIASSGVRAAFRVGDEVKVVEGEASGFIGWVTEITQDKMRISDVGTEKEVNVKFEQVEFHCAPLLAAVPRPRKQPKTQMSVKDPNRIYIGKKVLVIGAHTYKGYRGLIKATSPEGLAWVELEACHQRVEQLSLLDLAIQQPDGDLYSLRNRGIEARIMAPQGSQEQLPIVPSTPIPSPALSTHSPAWDPSSRTPGRSQHWLEDPCLANMRVKLRVQGSGEGGKIMEFLGVVGDCARVREASAIKTIDLRSLVWVPPMDKGDLVTTLSGEMRGKILKVRDICDDRCVARIPGKKLKKNEDYPSFPVSSLFQVFPAYR